MTLNYYLKTTKTTTMVDRFDLLKITPWKYLGQSNTDQWTLSVFHGLYNVRTKQIVRIVIVDDSKTYAIRLKHMIMRIVQVQSANKGDTLCRIRPFSITTTKRFAYTGVRAKWETDTINA